ncbi:DUF4189 domain-containing protein [Mycobacterium sp. 1274756.6]|uniref:DUF4189 domain-containing protein n=1 Tax=Mycobacterium sp. 1274756.6 TaxID=1834076 RepID=UPI0008014598|nr:hypothetical protein A5643_16555 [Mycobacterium sp. 1274756.6]
MAKAALRRRVAAVMASFATVVGLTVAVAPAADAATYWGAIAYSPSTGSGGRAWDHPTKESANSMALSYCGYTDCKVLVSFTDCGAVAENATSLQGGYGRTLLEAMNDAMGRLPGSWILTWACN